VQIVELVLLFHIFFKSKFMGYKGVLGLGRSWEAALCLTKYMTTASGCYFVAAAIFYLIMDEEVIS